MEDQLQGIDIKQQVVHSVGSAVQILPEISESVLVYLLKNKNYHLVANQHH